MNRRERRKLAGLRMIPGGGMTAWVAEALFLVEQVRGRGEETWDRFQEFLDLLQAAEGKAAAPSWIDDSIRVEGIIRWLHSYPDQDPRGSARD